MDVTKKVPVREQAPDVRNKNFDGLQRRRSCIRSQQMY